jgi:glycosyltransferase involved in cell wall biosynthesis
VVIPCFNQAHYLPEAVASVCEQSFQNFEIIIVNDGSTDETQEVAQQLVSNYQNHRIQIINQSNSGLAAARNAGIYNSSGMYVLPLDADDLIATTMLAECIDLLREKKTVSIAYTHRLDFGEVNQVVKTRPYSFSSLKYTNHISYCSLYRKQVWEEVGGYRTHMRTGEDWDFWIAAGMRGHVGSLVRKPLFKYRVRNCGLYQEVLKNFEYTFAQIILNNSEVYNSEDIDSAKRVLQYGENALCLRFLQLWQKNQEQPLTKISSKTLKLLKSIKKFINRLRLKILNYQFTARK